MDIETLSAIADWADTKKVDISFGRTDMGDWRVTAHFKDSRGNYSASAPMPACRRKPRRKKVNGEIVRGAGEELHDFEDRIRKTMGSLCVQAHKSRIGLAIAA